MGLNLEQINAQSSTRADSGKGFAANSQNKAKREAAPVAAKSTPTDDQAGSSLVLRDSSVQALSTVLSAKKQQYQNDREQVKAQLRKVQTTLETAYGSMVDDVINELEGEGIHFPKASPLTLPDFSL
jgi:hypothetical protein